MAKICYADKRFSDGSLQMLQIVNNIIEDYSTRGFSLTLRQLYYQLVGHDLFPDDRRWSRVGNTNKWVRDPNGTKNADPNYKWLGVLVSDGRLAGYIDWDAITDRTRVLKKHTHWENPGHIMNAVKNSFRMDHWKDQDYYVECFVEKDALVEVVGMACSPLDVPYFACRGYTSQSAMWEAAMRIQDKIDKDGISPVIIHLGDHDPSGVDMSRDIEERLTMFGTPPIFRRIALNMDQINQYAPPPNPTKLTDSRSGGYLREFGEDCWELDSLDPEVIVNLITEEINKWVNPDLKAMVIAQEQEYLEVLDKISKNWETLV